MVLLFRSALAQTRGLLRRKSFLIVFYLLLGAVLANFIRNVWTYRGSDVVQMYHPMKLLLLSVNGGYLGFYFMQLFPILVVLPGGFSFAWDKESNEAVFLSARVGRKAYMAGKFLAVFSATFLAFSVPLLLELGLNCLAFPLGATGDPFYELYSPGYQEAVRHYLGTGLYVASPYGYAVVFTLLFGVAAGVLGAFVAAVSTFPIKYKVLLFLPAYVVLDGVLWLEKILPGAGASVSTSYFAYFQLFDEAPKSGLGYGLLLGGLFALSVLIFLWRGRKDWLR